MIGLLVKSTGYIILIILGYQLKRAGIFQLSAKDVLGNVLMYITLPFSFIANFRNFEMDASLFIYLAIGFTANLIMVLIGKIISRNRTGESRALYMIDCSGYNIGAFATPFIGSVYPSQATVVSSMFDIGNCIISIGGIYPLAKREVSSDRGNIRQQLMFLIKKLFSSVPFDTYLIMLALSLIGVQFPAVISDTAAVLGAPSIILTMIMIGIAVEVKVSREDIGDIVKILAIRYLMAAVLMMIISRLPFLGELSRQTLSVCIFAPATSISPSYCNLCGCKPQIYGAVSSLSVIISLIIFVFLIS